MANEIKKIKVGSTDFDIVDAKAVHNDDLMPAMKSGTTLATMPLFHLTRANRIAFLPAAQIIAEQSTDGGATWVSAGLTDSQKAELFAGRNNGTIKLPLIDGKKNVNAMVRLTITGMKYKVPEGTAETDKYAYWNPTYVASNERYCALSCLYFWLSSNSDRIWLKVEAARGNAANTWIKLFDTSVEGGYVGMTGWSGMDVIRLPGYNFGGGTGQTGNYWNYRMTFRTCTGVASAAGIFDQAKLSSSYQTDYQCINGIMGYGDSVWGVSNQMMKVDHLYDWNASQQALFPSDISEGGKFLSAKYLGIAAKAADSSKLNGQAASYYLDYTHLSNKPNIDKSIEDAMKIFSVEDLTIE